MTHPFTINLFLPDGIPEGLKIIEKSNWSGCGLSLPRASFSKHKQRLEFQKPGIYFLIGDLDVEPKMYIGEGDPLLNRILSHSQNKNFWDLLIAFTSKDQNLNKSAIQYLEAHLIQLAHNTGRFSVMNEKNPREPSLSEMDRAVCDGYLRELLLCLPLLGINLSREPAGCHPANKLFIRAKNLNASGSESPEGFLVHKESQATFIEAPSIPPGIKALRSTLIERGILTKLETNTFKFSQNYLFSSPSTASSVILGRSSNGRLEWRNEKGRSLGEIEDSNEN
ncbi:MAG: GIY-YIG nuclease family protein [Chlamydiales bacterium]